MLGCAFEVISFNDRDKNPQRNRQMTVWGNRCECTNALELVMLSFSVNFHIKSMQQARKRINFVDIFTITLHIGSTLWYVVSYLSRQATSYHHLKNPFDSFDCTERCGEEQYLCAIDTYFLSISNIRSCKVHSCVFNGGFNDSTLKANAF